MSPPKGPVVGGYALGETIGTGGYSKVKEAWGQDGEKVAVKITRLGGEGDDGARREVEVLQELGDGCGNLVGLVEVMESEKYLYTVLEFVPDDLFNVMAAVGKLPSHEVRWIFKGVLNALQYLHDHGVAHLDVKPENILLDVCAQTVRLADFGLALIDITTSTTPTGSPSYAAPEVQHNVSTPTPYNPYKADIWSLGTTLHVMLTMTPFTPEVLKSRTAHPFVKYIMRVDPEQRPTLSAIEQHPWLAPHIEVEG